MTCGVISGGEVSQKDQDSYSDGKGERPWWMPEDLEGKAERLEAAMVDSLTVKQKAMLLHMNPERMSKKAKSGLMAAVFLGGMESEDFRLELAKAMLMKPLEATKQMGAFVPKTLEVEGEIKHHYAIVVPAELSNDQWNAGQKVLGEVMAEGWSAQSPWGNVQDAVLVERED